MVRPLAASLAMTPNASPRVTAPDDSADSTVPTACPPVFPPCPASSGTKYANSI